MSYDFKMIKQAVHMAYIERKGGFMGKRLVSLICPNCSANFQTRYRFQKYCSEQCRKDHYMKRNSRDQYFQILEKKIDGLLERVDALERKST